MSYGYAWHHCFCLGIVADSNAKHQSVLNNITSVFFNHINMCKHIFHIEDGEYLGNNWTLLVYGFMMLHAQILDLNFERCFHKGET